MRKVCILSMQRVNNFGSLLQAYGLKKTINNLGFNVSFIDIKSIEEDMKLVDNEKSFNYEFNKKKFMKRIDKYFFNRLKMRFLNKKQNELFEQFRLSELNISDDCNDKQYDICVIGSDEVFNCATESPWGFTSQLFGNVENAKRVITYAASCGATVYDDLNPKIVNKIKKSFEGISAFSVRDDNTNNFVKSFGINNINYNLDPVMIYDFDEELKENSNIKLPDNYCIVYSYYNRFSKKEEIQKIKDFCKKHNLKLVSIGAPQFWIKRHLVLNPFEALYAFKKASFVITDTFHGTIFASKYSKKFATLVRDSNKNKLTDLIKRLNKQKHLCNNIDKLDECYSCNNNISETKKISDVEKSKTIQYLKNNI